MKLFDDFQSGTFKREGYDGNISVTLSDDGRYISIHSGDNSLSESLETLLRRTLNSQASGTFKHEPMLYGEAKRWRHSEST